MEYVKAHMKVKTDTGYKTILPSTVVEQVRFADGTNLDDYLKNLPATGGSGSSIAKSTKTHFLIDATSNGQTEFPFTMDFFDPKLDDSIVHVNGQFIYPVTDYSIVVVDGQPKVVLVSPINLGDSLHLTIIKNVLMSPDENAVFATSVKTYTIEVTSEGQKVFNFNDSTFKKDSAKLMVFIQNEIMEEDVEYTISDTTSAITMTTGVPLGYKIHIVSFRTDLDVVAKGKITENNFDPATLNEVKGNVSSLTFFVDASIGNDENDGFTEITPIKTLARLASLLNDKKTLAFQSVEVNLSAGTFYDLSLDKVRGRIIIKGKGSANTIIKSSADNKVPVIIRNSDHVMFTGVSIINTPTSTAGGNLEVYNSREVRLEPDTLIVGGRPDKTSNTAIIANDSSTVLSKASFSNCYRIVLSQVNSMVTIMNYTSDVPNAVCDVGLGSIIDISKSVGLKVNSLTNIGGGLDVSAINNGIIVESGSNANGKFIKYADGTLICLKTISSVDINVAVGQKYTAVHQLPFSVPRFYEGVAFYNGYATNHNGTAELKAPFCPQHTNNTFWSFAFWNTASEAMTRILDLNLVFIGRWK